MQSRSSLGQAAGAVLLITIELSASPLFGPAALAQDGTGPSASIWPLPAGAGRARMSLPELPEQASGVVIVVPDGRPRDSRAEPYVKALHRAGFGTLELGYDGHDRSVPELLADLDAARLAVRARTGFAGAQVMALGFGAGAEAVLARAGSLPVAALYPQCPSLPEPPDPWAGPAAQPVLLLLDGATPSPLPRPCHEHGGYWGALVEAHVYHRVAAGWDAPDPAQPGPRAVRRPDVTLDAARRVADFFGDLLVPALAEREVEAHPQAR
jgi:dienelactone hydrolase